MPLKPGIIPVDEWVPTKEEEIFTHQGKIVNVPFDKLFPGIEITNLNNFLLIYKDAYVGKATKGFKQIKMINNYINYFINFYDKDNELLLAYLHLKYVLDLKNMKLNRESFIKLMLEVIFTPSICEKIRQMSIDNYRVDLTSQNDGKKDENGIPKKNIKYSESLEFTNEHGRIIMQISTAIKIAIPLVLHYMAVYKTKKESDRIHEYFMPFFNLLNDGVNIYMKLYQVIYAATNYSKTKNHIIYDKHEAFGEDEISEIEKLLKKNIITDTVFKYAFNGNIISFNKVIIERQLVYHVITDLGSDIRELSIVKDSEGLSSLDKMEMSTVKIDEFRIIMSDVNIEKTIKRIRKCINVELDKKEIKYYMENFRINNISKTLVFYFYAKYFGGFNDLNLIKRKQFIILLLLLKKRMECKRYLYLNKVLTANIEGRMSTRTIHNSKFLEKISESSIYKNLIDSKFTSLNKMGKGSIIIDLLSSIINTKFTIVDYDNPEKTGELLDINTDILSEEFLDLINQI